jgi:hypothetical protein
MKFRVTLKDPDTLYDAIREEVEGNLANIDDLADHEKDALVDGRIDDIKEVAAKWFEYGEYLTVEIDTEARTCTVVPVS